MASDLGASRERIIAAAAEPVTYESNTYRDRRQRRPGRVPRPRRRHARARSAPPTPRCTRPRRSRQVHVRVLHRGAGQRGRHDTSTSNRSCASRSTSSSGCCTGSRRSTPTTGAWVGVEGLIRWQHPTRGLLPPSEFIDLAEETGHDRAHGPLGHRGRVPAVRRRGAGPVLELQHCSVNLSVRQLDIPTMLAEIVTALAANGIAPRQLELEVTESSIMTDAAQGPRHARSAPRPRRPYSRSTTSAPATRRSASSSGSPRRR